MTDKKTLEDALAEMEAKKSKLAEYRVKHAVEIKAEDARISALNKRLDSLSESERRQVLDAAGLKHVSAAPRPIDPIRASRSMPPNMPLELVAMAEQQNIEQLVRERNRAKERDAMRVPGAGGGSISRRFFPTEPQRPAPEQEAAAPVPVVAALVEPNDKTGPNFSMTKAAMLAQHIQHWPTISRDMQDAKANGLDSAKAGVRGWIEVKALAWARANNKLTDTDKPAGLLAQAMNSMANTPGRRHTLEG